MQALKVYNLTDIDLCIHPRNYHHNQCMNIVIMAKSLPAPFYKSSIWLLSTSSPSPSSH